MVVHKCGEVDENVRMCKWRIGEYGFQAEKMEGAGNKVLESGRGNVLIREREGY